MVKIPSKLQPQFLRPVYCHTQSLFKIDFLKGAVSYFTHIFFSFFLVFLQTSYGLSRIKTYKLHYFYLILYSETTDRGEITVTTTFTSGLDLCMFPCFKYIVYQINSFALIAKWFPSIFIILVVLFFVRNYRVSHYAHPHLRAPSWILNLKTLAQRFQVCYAQKHMREIWHCSFNIHVEEFPLLLHPFWNQWCFLQSDWLKIVRLIPKSHHFECDYKLIALSPKIQSNERTELKQPICFKFRNTKNIKLNFFKAGSFPKS